MKIDSKTDPAKLEMAKQAMKNGALAVVRGLLVMLIKTWVAMIAINWLDVLRHPLTFVQTFVLAFVVNMLFARADVNTNKTKQNPNNDGTRGNDVDNK